MAHRFGRAIAVFGARRDTASDQPAPRRRKIIHGPLPIGGNDDGLGSNGHSLRIGLRGWQAGYPLGSPAKSELRSDGKLKHAPPMRRSRLEMAKLQWPAGYPLGPPAPRGRMTGQHGVKENPQGIDVGGDRGWFAEE